MFFAGLVGRCAIALRALTLLLLVDAYDGHSKVVDCRKVDPEADRCLLVEEIPLPARSSLIQKQHALSLAGVERRIVDGTLLEQPGPRHSPVQKFFMAHPSWLLFLIAFGVIGSLGSLVWAVSWLLDQFEARRWASGHIGKPWYMDENMVTYVGGGALGLWIGIGMFLFTTLVHFHTPQSEVRSLTKIEAFYLCVQILTTVGYGDLTPSDTASQAVLIAFILVGVVLVATVVTEFLKVLARRTERAIAKMTHKNADAEAERRASLNDIAEESEASSLDSGVDEKITTASKLMAREQELAKQTREDRLRMLMDFFSSTGPFAFSVAAGTVFFYKYPGEDKSLWEACYMSCVTLTTVGFGQITPSTQGGKMFGALWMFVGVGATAHMVLCFGNAFLRRHREIQVDQLQYELLAEMDEDGDHRVDKCEFLRFELIRTGLCEKEDIDAILHRFNKLDLDKSGSIDVEDLKAIRHIRGVGSAARAGAVSQSCRNIGRMGSSAGFGLH